MILHIACSKYTGNICTRRITRSAAESLDIAINHSELAIKNIGIRFVADSDKHSLGGYFFFSPVRFNNSDAGHPGMITKYFIDLTMPFDFHFTLRDFSHETVNQNRLGSKFIAAMNDCDFFSNSGEVEGFFDCGVAAPDYTNILVFIEKPIASCTS